MDKKSLKDFTKIERKEFYQSKYEYYAAFMRRLVIVSFLTYMCFFVVDCLATGQFSYRTVITRGISIIPFLIYLILAKKVKDYRIMVFSTHVMIHFIIWCTNLVIFTLGNTRFEIPGMLINNLMFVCAGLGSPFYFNVISHILFLVDIGLANLFIHYQDLPSMYLFNIACVISICIMSYMMQQVYVEQYRIQQQLEHLVVHDQLTKVNNRNKLKELSNIRGELVAFSDIPLSMLLLDIDYFKQVNDEYGHEAGDVVLVHLAKVLKETLRVTDYVIRWGGEEFLIILPGCVTEQAVMLAEKVRQKVAESDSGICPITISVGVAQHEPGDYHITIKKADEALYTAKRNGRNQVAVYKKMNV